MKPSRGTARWLPACYAIVFLTSAFRLPPSAFGIPSSRAPLYVSFLDQLSPQEDSPSTNGLEERRRGPVFENALQSVAGSDRNLPSVIIINRDLHLPETVADEPPVPPGATLVRVYLTKWAQQRLGGFAVSEVQCRIFVELVRDGHPAVKLGPFLGRTPYALTGMTTGESRYTVFRDAARQALDEMLRALPHQRPVSR